ncbi:MAG: DUF1801 domain-containing protein [Steroidobacteraceae bacterium]
MVTKRSEAKDKSKTGKSGKTATKSSSKVSAKVNSATKTKSVAKTKSAAANDWRAVTLDEIRQLIHQVSADIVEERKWIKPTNPAGVPTWSQSGIICTGETYKQVVKLTFAKGAALEDPSGLFNSSLEGNTRRAIDIREGEKLDAKAFKALIRAAIDANSKSSAAKSKPASVKAPKAKQVAAKPVTVKQGAAKTKAVKLLSGGNPQIAKADGDAPVQAYIDAIPGWKQDVARRLDVLITSSVPRVNKAVKWNSPFYGVEGQGWFVSFHVFARYIKLTFFKGTLLKSGPVGGASKEARWVDIHEDDFDEKQIAAWVTQAARLPGWLA